MRFSAVLIFSALWLLLLMWLSCRLGLGGGSKPREYWILPEVLLCI